MLLIKEHWIDYHLIQPINNHSAMAVCDRSYHHPGISLTIHELDRSKEGRYFIEKKFRVDVENPDLLNFGRKDCLIYQTDKNEIKLLNSLKIEK